jgi:hypothetical protein
MIIAKMFCPISSSGYASVPPFDIAALRNAGPGACRDQCCEPNANPARNSGKRPWPYWRAALQLAKLGWNLHA